MRRTATGIAAAGDVPVPAMPGLGPQSREWLAQLGINTAAQLRAREPFEVYAQLRALFPGTSLNLLYALIGAIEGRHWQEVRKEQRTAILLRLEQMGLLR